MNIYKQNPDSEFDDYLEYLRETKPTAEQILGESGLLVRNTTENRRARLNALLTYAKDEGIEIPKSA